MTAEKRPYKTVLLYLFGVVTVALFLTPYFWMVAVSLRSTSEMMKNPGTILPIVWTIKNYVKVLTKSPFFTWFLNSVKITGSVTLLVLFTSSLTGYVFAKYRFPMKNTLFWLVLATMMVPAQVTMIPGFLIINAIGLYNTLYALIIPAAVSAFGIFLCRQFCEDIPDSLCEAAFIDGAGDFYIYRRIILPLLRPCLAALAIFTFLDTWNDYLGPLIMLESVKRMTLPVALSFFSDQHTQDSNAVMAAAVLMMTPVTVLFLSFQKQFIKGITLTGVK